MNVFLALYQFKFQPIAWFVTAGWVLVGVLLYYAVFEKRAAVLEPQVIHPHPIPPGTEVEPSVVVALHNPENAEPLLRLAASIARQRAVRLVATSVVEVPRQVPIHDGVRLAHHKEAILNQTRRIAAELKVDLDTDTVIAHRSADGILAAITQHRAEALVMGWKGYTNTRDRLFGEIADRIIRQAPCDLMIIKLGKSKELKSCFLPTAGGPNARLAATVLDAVAKDLDMSVTAGYVLAQDADDEQRAEGERRTDETIALLDPSITTNKVVVESKSIAGGIATTGREYDLVVIGAAKEPFFRKMLFGEIPEKVARYSPSAVMVVKRYEGAIKSVFKRLFG